MDINYLINMYEKELQTLKDDFGANLTSEIANVKARTEALAIQRFIANLKNLPNELKGVSNNEQSPKCDTCRIRKGCLYYSNGYNNSCPEYTK